MAEWGLKGPLFYHGHYGHPSVKTEDMTPEQRSEYRSIYRRLYRKFGHKSYKERMRARKTLRGMLYEELGIKDRLR